MFSTCLMVTPILEDKLPKLLTSFCIYRFNCSCGTSYIGWCPRNLYFRAREYLSVLLSKGIVETVNGPILAHSVRTGHTARMEQSFTMIDRVNSSPPFIVISQVLVYLFYG